MPDSRRARTPEIARLLDGGTTAAGLPYLEMEYVEGVPVSRYYSKRNYQKAIEIYQNRRNLNRAAFVNRKPPAKDFGLLGDLQKVRGSLAEELSFHRQEREILKLVLADGSLPETRLDLLNSYSNIATSFYFIGESQKSPRC